MLFQVKSRGGLHKVVQSAIVSFAHERKVDFIVIGRGVQYVSLWFTVLLVRPLDHPLYVLGRARDKGRGYLAFGWFGPGIWTEWTLTGQGNSLELSLTESSISHTHHQEHHCAVQPLFCVLGLLNQAGGTAPPNVMPSRIA